MRTLRVALVLMGFLTLSTACEDISGPDLGLGDLEGLECLVAWEDPACTFGADSVAVDTVAADSTDGKSANVRAHDPLS